MAKQINSASSTSKQSKSASSSRSVSSKIAKASATKLKKAEIKHEVKSSQSSQSKLAKSKAIKKEKKVSLQSKLIYAPKQALENDKEDTPTSGKSELMSKLTAAFQSFKKNVNEEILTVYKSCKDICT